MELAEMRTFRFGIGKTRLDRVTNEVVRKTVKVGGGGEWGAERNATQMVRTRIAVRRLHWAEGTADGGRC